MNYTMFNFADSSEYIFHYIISIQIVIYLFLMYVCGCGDHESKFRKYSIRENDDTELKQKEEFSSILDEMHAIRKELKDYMEDKEKKIQILQDELSNKDNEIEKLQNELKEKME